MALNRLSLKKTFHILRLSLELIQRTFKWARLEETNEDNNEDKDKKKASLHLSWKHSIKTSSSSSSLL